jgi:dCMP deaminase
MTRQTWPETWMEIARIVAKRSYSPRLQVGAIIVSFDNTQLLSLGYNGNYSGGPHEPESFEPGLDGFVHAEVNAVIKLDYHNHCKKVMYVTHVPCRACGKVLINAKIDRIVYDQPYRDMSSLEMMRIAGIDVMSLEEAIRMTRGHETK